MHATSTIHKTKLPQIINRLTNLKWLTYRKKKTFVFFYKNQCKLIYLIFSFVCFPFFYFLLTEWFGTRHFVTCMLFLGMANAYVMRTNMSVAIVAMVNHTFIEEGLEEVFDDECKEYNMSSTSNEVSEWKIYLNFLFVTCDKITKTLKQSIS